MVDKEPERRAAYPELNTLHLDNATNITVTSDIITTQKKKMGDRKNVRKIVIFITNKVRKIRV